MSLIDVIINEDTETQMNSFKLYIHETHAMVLTHIF